MRKIADSNDIHKLGVTKEQLEKDHQVPPLYVSALERLSDALIFSARTILRVLDVIGACLDSVLSDSEYKTFNDQGSTPLAKTFTGRSQFFPHPHRMSVSRAFKELDEVSKALDVAVPAVITDIQRKDP